MRALGRTPETFVRHLPRVGAVESRLPNGRALRLWSRGDDHVANQVYWKEWRGYESETTPLFYELASKASVVFDVGAHVGFYSLLAAHANPSGRVLAFEPLPKAAERFRRNVAENGLTNVELFECALGDAEGSATLYHEPDSAEGVPTSSGLSSHFFQLPYYVSHGVKAGIDVRVTTIDEVARERNVARVDLIKIDTETTEPAVLAGAAETLARDRPDLVFEVLPGQGTSGAITRLLKPLGYTFYHLRDDGPVRREEIEDHADWWNYFARARGDEGPGGAGPGRG
jgi:FkbM family methyltransferase